MSLEYKRDQFEDEASTDAAEDRAPLMSDLALPTSSQRSKASRASIICFLLSITFFVGGLVSLALVPRYARAARLHTPEELFYPAFPTTMTEFKDDIRFQDPGPQGLKTWNEMYPVGAGYFRIDRPERYNLPRSEPAPGQPNTYIYAASITHQLHCLAQLRQAVNEYINGTEHAVLRHAGAAHLRHCVEYVRQALTCAADTTIEWGKPVLDPTNTTATYHFDGEGSLHQCRDWSSVKRFLEMHRSSDKHEILPA